MVAPLPAAATRPPPLQSSSCLPRLGGRSALAYCNLTGSAQTSSRRRGRNDACPWSALHPERSVLLIVDVQPTFMRAIHEGRAGAVASHVPGRCRAATRRYRCWRASKTRSGWAAPTPPSPLASGRALPKMAFSCAGCGDDMMISLEATGRRQAVIVGIETHICVSQTARRLLRQGYEVDRAAPTPSRPEPSTVTSWAWNASATPGQRRRTATSPTNGWKPRTIPASARRSRWLRLRLNG